MLLQPRKSLHVAVDGNGNRYALYRDTLTSFAVYIILFDILSLSAI